MTALELYNLALALLNEIDTDAKDYPKLKLPYINLALAQSFTTENWIRACKGKEILDAIPAVHRDSDALIYDADFCRECLPYLLAAMLATDEDRDLANVYLKTYARLAEKYLLVQTEPMENVYGEASA